MQAHGESSVRTCCSRAHTHVLLHPPLLGTKARIPGPQWNETFQLKSTSRAARLAVIKSIYGCERWGIEWACVFVRGWHRRALGFWSGQEMKGRQTPASP